MPPCWTYRQELQYQPRQFKLDGGRTDYRPGTVRGIGSDVVVRGHAEGNEVNCLVDTGSHVTLVNASLLRQLGIDKVDRTKYVLSSFAENKIDTIGEVNLLLRIADTEAYQTCIVVKDNMECDILLGMDFIRTRGLCVNRKDNMLESSKGFAKFLPAPTRVIRRIKVRSSSTVIIPANSMTFVKGTLQNQNLDKKTVYSGLLEPYANLSGNGLFAAESLSHSEKNEIPIRVLNPSDEPVVLHRRKLLGFLNPPPQTKKLANVKGVQSINTSTTDIPHETEHRAKHDVEEWTKSRLFKELCVTELEISEQERCRLEEITWKYRNVFSRHEFDLGNCNFYTASIKLKPNAEPQYVCPIPTPYKQRDALQKHMDGMLDNGIISEITGEDNPWNSRVFLVAKPHQPGQFRFVADFRALNSQCLPDTYMLPRINTVTDKMAGAKWFSTFDLSKSFYEVDYDRDLVKLTAFTANRRRYVFNKLVMGHVSSSSQFARMIDQLLANIPLDQLAYFLDDLMIASEDKMTHFDRLELLLERLSKANLKLMPSKCKLLRRKVEFVGWTISDKGVSINDERVKAVKDLPAPRNFKETQKVVGFLSYHRKFVKGFAGLAKPIYELLDKDTRFFWNNRCQEGFEEIKRRIAQEINLTLPRVDDPEQSYVVTIDASEHGYGAELAQRQDGELKTIAFFSKRVPKHKRRWSQSKLEFECLVETLQHFALYLKGTRFLVKTDCLSLLSLEKLFAKANSTMIRRLNKLADFRFELEHLKGSENEIADFFSRYLFKTRVENKSTQTAEDRNAESAVQVKSVSANTTRVQEDSSTQGCTTRTTDKDFVTENNEMDVLINEEVLTANWKSSEPVDFSKVRTRDACICSTDVLAQNNTERIDVKVSTIGSSITQQLELGEIIEKDRLIQEQNRDPVLVEVKKWLETGKPDKLQRLRLPRDLLTYWKQLHLIVIREGLLCKKWILHNKSSKEIEIQRYLVLIPESLKKTVLDQHHASLITMHPGVDETYNQILRRYYWPQLREEVDIYVKSCVTCGSCKQPRAYLKAPLRHVITYEFGDAISIDHIVPEKEGVTKRGYCYILTLTDVFTGYLVALPCKTRRSEETIRLIQHGWCLKYGYPREILADNDTSFTAEIFNEVCRYFKIRVTHGVPYKCSSTAKAERSNKRINQSLRVTLTDKQIRYWDLYLNYVTFALNSLKSRHTGFSANFMLFGWHLNTPLNLELNGDPVQLDSSAKKGTTAYQIYRTIREICLKARRHAALDFSYAYTSYNKNLHGPYFQQGDWVYTLIECPSHKFAKRWQGPYQVTKGIDDHLYVVDLGSRDKLVNISKLKRYVKSRYSLSQLNANASQFEPTEDVNNTSVTGKQDSRSREQTERHGMEVEIVPETAQSEIQHMEDSTTTTHQATEDTEQCSPQPADCQDDPTEQDNAEEMDDSGFEIVAPPEVDPFEASTAPPRRNPTRARNAPNFLQLFRGTKSYG